MTKRFFLLATLSVLLFAVVAVLPGSLRLVDPVHAQAVTAPSKTAPPKTAPSKAAPSKTAPSKAAPSKAAESNTVLAKHPIIVCSRDLAVVSTTGIGSLPIKLGESCSMVGLVAFDEAHYVITENYYDTKTGLMTLVMTYDPYWFLD